jgi:hypothetical protein
VCALDAIEGACEERRLFREAPLMIARLTLRRLPPGCLTWSPLPLWLLIRSDVFRLYRQVFHACCSSLLGNRTRQRID